MTAFYSPMRGLRVYLAGALRQWRCGRRFGHFRSEDRFAGYARCARCGIAML